MTAYPVMLAPIPMPRVWGGSKLKGWFSVACDEPIGEYWVLSAHPSAPNVVQNGPLAGITLSELTERFPQEYLGISPQGRFPLLIKFLEAEQNLSVQIHPDDEYARAAEGDCGKTEAWYVLDHAPDARVILGHTFEDREQYLSAVAEGRVCDFLREESLEKDSLFFVPAKTLHALLAGTVLIEVQQTSDITYRVYDWERGRELHLEKAADVMTYGTPPCADADLGRRIVLETEGVRQEHLLTCPYFSIEKVTLQSGGLTLANGHPGNPDVLIVADGAGELFTESLGTPLLLERGSTVLVPGNCTNYQLRTASTLTLLRTYY
ncbi:MAG: type I phosphomannose isomerase catalytic subunit [Tumebacillaceae bacterium]